MKPFIKVSLIKKFLEEILLYSGQFGLFYIIMQFIIEKAGFFLNFGHVCLLLSLLLQAIILSVFGTSMMCRLLFSFLVPVVYSSIEFLEGSAYLLNAAHVGFWIYAVVSSLFMVVKQQGTESYSRLAESMLVVVNISIFIFLYFYFDTWKEISDKDLLTINNILNFIPAFLSDATHVFIISGGILLAGTVALGRYEISRLKDRIYHLFGRYVDKNVRDKIIQDGDMTSRRVKLCVLFSDIHDFTVLCENTDPGSVTAMLNIYFDAWDSVVKKHHGIIDKYIGDAIMVIFGLEEPRHACNSAVACSVEMYEKYTDIVDILKGKNLPVLDGFGIGCHTGDVIVGDIGSMNRKNFTVIGDTVNIASRLESATRATNNQMLISSQVYHELDGPIRERFYRIGRLDLKGKKETIEAWGMIQEG